MPRLSVSGRDNGPDNGPPLPTIRIGKGGFVVFIILTLVWLGGVLELPDLLGVSCGDGGFYGKARLIDTARCMIAAGPTGWLYLGWSAALPLAIMIWLERKLRQFTLQRKADARRNG